jgi:uncharacterized protein YoaH (UPF0181 family)
MNTLEWIHQLQAEGYTWSEAIKIVKKEGRKARRKQLAEQRKQQPTIMNELNRWMHSYLRGEL